MFVTLCGTSHKGSKDVTAEVKWAAEGSVKEGGASNGN